MIFKVVLKEEFKVYGTYLVTAGNAVDASKAVCKYLGDGYGVHSMIASPAGCAEGNSEEKVLAFFYGKEL